jgi:fumarate reductase flavoprotein subunit
LKTCSDSSGFVFLRKNRVIRNLPVIAAVLILPLLVSTGCPVEAVDGPDRSVDVLVVGSGIAGSMAALSAKEAGAANVLVIEKASFFGGTARLALGTFATAVVNAKNDPQTSLAEWRGYMAGAAEDTGYPDYNKWLAVAKESADTLDYLRSLGLNIMGQVYGGGRTLMSKLEETITSQKIEILFNCEAAGIILENGTVTGVQALYKRRPFRINAKSVVLATGGFSQNPELVSQWAGANPGLNYVVSMADTGSTGEGILMAQEAGAALHNNTFTKIAGLQFSSSIRVISAFSQSSLLAAAAAPLNTQILVNHNAERIMNEAIGGSFGNVSSFNSDAAYLMVKDAQPPYYIIYDSGNEANINAALNAAAALRNGEVFTADTIPALAGLMEVPPAALTETLRRYNEFVDKGSDETFGKGPAYLKKIEDANAPYYAVKVYPNSYGSMGGVVTDSSGHVLDAKGRAIPRLYAAGEIANRDFFNQTYVGGASLALYSAAGWLAGKTAAE